MAYPSANPIMRMHWAKRKKIVDSWRFVVAALFSNVPHAAKPRAVRIIRHGSRQLDFSNLWLGADKLIFDSLVAAELLVDDTPQFLEPTLEQVKCKRKDEKTVIEIAERDHGHAAINTPTP